MNSETQRLETVWAARAGVQKVARCLSTVMYVLMSSAETVQHGVTVTTVLKMPDSTHRVTVSVCQHSHTTEKRMYVPAVILGVPNASDQAISSVRPVKMVTSFNPTAPSVSQDVQPASPLIKSQRPVRAQPTQSPALHSTRCPSTGNSNPQLSMMEVSRPYYVMVTSRSPSSDVVYGLTVQTTF